ncbi:twin-arginine translocation pathway signal [Bradyrhizobium neotropicale]|uniref:twin-arginine translocation pathway signal n=1 Tax=Bradyrhizobium neotropicale TaxID=1497615 RepID=UPI001AD683C5|nr:twin-arginine translocation pathway signal [Bradyrhizobium neotropicale]MBO4226306.1 twin-arginine translocation pathway signal [Bradyrhizobium neotropicale]
MSIRTFLHLPPRAAVTAALLALGGLLCGCAQMGETLSPAFVDPAKYDLYDCKQLETERAALTSRAAELQGLMSKAETGVGGAVVAEVAYRNDYVAVRAQQKLAEENWRRSRCDETIVATPAPIVPPVPARGARSR